MSSSPPQGIQVTAQERRIAWGRLILGQLQIAGATCTLVLLLKVGAQRSTLWAAAISAGFTITSRLIFRKKRMNKQHNNP